MFNVYKTDLFLYQDLIDSIKFEEITKLFEI